MPGYKRVIIVLASFVFVTILFITHTDTPTFHSREVQYGNLHLSNSHASTTAADNNNILFVGDVMLARDVEDKLNQYTSDYAFADLKELLQAPTYVVGNFESSIANPHVQTPIMNMVFSTNPAHTETLSEVGFTHFSLANNHALDFAELGFQRASRTLLQHDLSVFGHPNTLATTSISIVQLASSTVGLIGLNTIGTTPQTEDLEKIMRAARELSDVQVVYVHWGTEYELLHNTEQIKLAEQLVSLGVDLIVGHHPHVVQDIQLINETPVIFSLGNFVFDQYFSKDVHEGLVVELKEVSENFILTLLPISTHGSRVRPRLMPAYERSVFLQDLANRSHSSLRKQIESGRIVLTRTADELHFDHSSSSMSIIQ